MNIMTNGPDSRDPSDEAIGRMIQDAGAREELPQADLDRIREVARATWQAKVRSRRRNRALGLALAATLAVAVIGVLLWPRSQVAPAPVPAVAVFELVKDDVVFSRADEGSQAVAVEGMEIREGDDIVTREGLASLRVGGVTSLRVASLTRIRILGASRVELMTGAVYVDTAKQGRLEVVTPYGEARDIGTQFMVQVDAVAETMRVAVREGEVSVRHDGEAHDVVDGSALTITADGTATREEISSWSGPWSWVLDAAPPFDVEGRLLSEYLRWVSRESGLEIRYEDSWVERLAGETTLHGSTGDLPPDEAALVVLPGAGLEGEIVDGALEVRRAR